MNANIDQNVIAKIQQLYQTDSLAQRLFDWTAQRKNDAGATSVETFSRELDVSRGEAVALSRRLGLAGCGDFKNGRRGQRSRFEWSYSCISLGRAAAGESSELEATQSPSVDADEDDDSLEAGNAGVPSLTISGAKQALAISLGVPVTSIEITIRS